ncbi:hypothetical protein KH5H1_33220 [Corallococcus caeni]|nr:hypothetical protein KH5H1_33220 [Corallococcus sp. KH5-1]
MLRGLTLAADDFLPPERPDTPCTERRASHAFRIIQREDILFIRIDMDPAACGGTRPGLDSGVRYAIRRDGRILRRVPDGMEPYIPSADGGVLEKAAPGVSPSFDPEHPRPLPFLDSSRDAGIPDASAPAPDVVPGPARCAAVWAAALGRWALTRTRDCECCSGRRSMA